MREELRQNLKELRDQGMRIDAVNPVSALSDIISNKITQGQISSTQIHQLLDDISEDIWSERHQSLRSYTGLDTLTDNLLPEWFDPINSDITRPIYRAVFTAHPVFALTAQSSDALCMATSSHEAGKPDPTFLESRRSITLEEEHQEALKALCNAREAIRKINIQIYQQRAQGQPETGLNQLSLLMGVSSWVGYDLDGRADITWIDSFCLRLKEKQVALEIYLKQLSEINLPEENAVTDIHAELKSEFDAIGRELESFTELSADNADFTQVMDQFTSRAGKLISSRKTADKIQKIATQITDKKTAIQLMVLASDMATHGFGIGEIHLRINAVQLRNSMRAVDGHGVTTTGGNASSRLLIDRLSKRIETEQPWQINFGNLDAETATARRQLMLATQIIKHIDCDQPIRLLIAECERPVTLMSALYLGHKFGIAENLDISPLFETVLGLERGEQIIEQLMANKVWMDYVRKRGRLSIQTGFSDAGRFLGQIAANLAIERLQIKLANLVAHYFNGAVDLLLFNTHGESLGRGCAGPTIQDRQNFILTPFVRNRAWELGLHIYHQSSFQGGDGYRLFGTQQLAHASIASLLKAETAPISEKWINDPFYSKSDFSLDLFFTLKNWQEALFNDPDYTSLLDLFQSNLLVKTGSRPTKRVVQQGMGRSNPSKIRAIPHNAILQQLGFLTNVISGFGSAASIDRDVFSSIASQSARLSQCLSHVLEAKQLGSLNTMLAYAHLLEAGYWIDKGYHDIQTGNLRSYRMLGQILSGRHDASSTARIVWKMRDDLIDLYQLTNQMGLEDARITGERRIDLDILHAIRIAVIIQSLLLVCRIPRFSEAGQYSNAQVLNLALSLDFASVAKIVAEIFSLNRKNEHKQALQEPQNYSVEHSQNYKQITEQILDPLANNNKIILKISQMISGYYGAHG